MKETIVIALGGNAIKSAGQQGTYEEQFDNIEKTTQHISQLIEDEYEVVITHGNGPQVGDLLLQHACAKKEVPPLPMFMCGAQTQGSIGLLIQQTLQNHLRRKHIKKSVATVITQVLVSPNDPAFKNPTKPVGPFYNDRSDFEAEEEKGFVFIEDSGRGYRRVVPSPKPLTIVELETIKHMIHEGIIVIASGGGGIPVFEKEGKLIGIDAVIDKDSAGQLMASELDAQILMILTDVEQVCLNYNTDKQKGISQMSLKECKQYIAEGQFAKGSMLPKIEAVVDFLEEGGKKAIITHPFKVKEAIQGKTGTLIEGEK